MRLRSPLAVTLIAVGVLAVLMALGVLIRPADQPSITGWEPSPAPLTSSVASTPAPADSPSRSFSAAEQRFLTVLQQDSGQDAASLVEEGHAFCTGNTSDSALASMYGGPPTLDALIENRGTEPVYPAAVRYLCPKYLPMLKEAQTGFTEGPQTVGKDVKPGTYRTTRHPVSDCYWERSTSGGTTIVNAMVTNAPAGVTVRIAASDGGFTSQGCGDWVRVG